jgi:hypothetical protein
LEKKQFDLFNYGSLIIIAVLLGLMVFKAIPANWYMPILVFGIALMGVRIFLRIKYANDLRKKERS